MMSARQAQERTEVSRVILEVPGDPVSANRMWRMGHGRNYESPEAVAWKKQVAWLARFSMSQPILGPVSVSITYYHRHPKRRLDLDNIAKPILDALIGTAYADDRQVVALHLNSQHDPENPRVRITVEDAR